MHDSTSGYADRFVEFDGQVIFAANSVVGTEPFITDGTPQGTRLLKDINVGVLGSNPSFFQPLNERVVFPAMAANNGPFKLYSTDGTTAGTVVIFDLSSAIRAQAMLGGKLYFITGNSGTGKLWCTDGTAAGTRLVWDQVTLNSDTGALVRVGNELIFCGRDQVAGAELRAVNADGMVRLVADLYPGTGSLEIKQLSGAGSKAYFVYWTEQYGDEIYVTDGTGAGTYRISDLPDAPISWGPPAPPLIVATGGGSAFFSIQTAASAYSLYGTDGTVANTNLLPLSFSAVPSATPMLVYGGKLFFRYQDAATGFEPWVSDGTVEGTHVFIDFRPGPIGAGASAFEEYDAKLYFYVSLTGGNKRMVSDGTVEGTHEDPNLYLPGTPRTLNGAFITGSSTGPAGGEPGVFDPATNTTTLLAELNPATTKITASQFVTAGQYTYFSSSGLWRTDGSSAGTVRVGVSYTMGKAAPDGRLFYLAGNTLFVTDGTVSGTTQLCTFPAAVSGFELVGNKVIAVTGQSGSISLYACDQTPSAAVLVQTLGSGIRQAITSPQINGHVVIAVKTIEYSFLWSTDGVVAEKIYEGLYGGTFGYVGGTSSAAFFANADQSGSGRQIVRTDGTISGTTNIMSLSSEFGGGAIFNDDLYVLANNAVYRSTGSDTSLTQFVSIPGPMVRYDIAKARAAVMGGLLYFVSSDGVTSNAALWKTDGTSGGTQTFSTLPVPLSGVGTPKNLTATDDRIYMDGDAVLYVTDGTAGGTGVEPGLVGGDFAANRAVLGNAIITFQQRGHYPLLRISSTPRGSIDGVMFNDIDGDGARDADEEGLPMQSVFLDLNDNGIFDAGDVSQFTDASGAYHFGGLLPATYHLRALSPAGLTPTTPASDVTVAAGPSQSRVDFGMRKPGSSSVPSVLQSRVRLDVSRAQIEVRFSEDIGALDLGGVVLTRLDGNIPVPLTQASVELTNDWNRLAIPVQGLGLVDGNYRLSIAASAIKDLAGNSLATPVVVDFFIMSGDANHDRKIDANDLSILSANWQGTSKTFSQGDFNYDGKVDIQDLYVLASKWQQTLPPPALPAIPASATLARRTPVRMISVVP